MITSRLTRIGSVAAALGLLFAGTATAAEPTASIKGSIKPSKISHKNTPVALTVKTAFGVTPAGSNPFTIQKAVVKFPTGAVMNGKMFPSCSADKINNAGGSFAKCPKGSKIGGGNLTADVTALSLTSVPGKVTMFNGPGGKSVVFHIRATNPANISEAFNAPLKKMRGTYGYQLTLPVPTTLQQILPGVFVAVRTFNVTTKASRTVNGRTRGYIEVVKCPKGGKGPIHGDFTFDGGTASADSTIRCTK